MRGSNPEHARARNVPGVKYRGPETKKSPLVIERTPSLAERGYEMMTFAASPATREILTAYAEHHGVSKSKVLRLAVEAACTEGWFDLGEES